MIRHSYTHPGRVCSLEYNGPWRPKQSIDHAEYALSSSKWASPVRPRSDSVLSLPGRPFEPFMGSTLPVDCGKILLLGALKLTMRLTTAAVLSTLQLMRRPVPRRIPSTLGHGQSPEGQSSCRHLVRVLHVTEALKFFFHMTCTGSDHHSTPECPWSSSDIILADPTSLYLLIVILILTIPRISRLWRVRISDHAAAASNPTWASSTLSVCNAVYVLLYPIRTPCAMLKNTHWWIRASHPTSFMELGPMRC